MDYIILLLSISIIILLARHASFVRSKLEILEEEIASLHEAQRKSSQRSEKELQLILKQQKEALNSPLAAHPAAPENQSNAESASEHEKSGITLGTPLEDVPIKDELLRAELESLAQLPDQPTPSLPTLEEKTSFAESSSRPHKSLPHISAPIPAQKKQYIPPEPELSFFERYPDIERFIGENLVNKIGIAILVLSIAYFVKYAIDSNWIGEVGRVAIGMICGAILLGFAHRLRSSYKAFSSVLVGGGLAVFYFTITLAFHQFHLFNQLSAFIILIVITVFAVMLALLYNKQELAIIALVGGFSSPFLVSTGNANFQGLFLYLVILNTGLLIIAYNKLWRLLNVISFVLTILVFGLVLSQLSGPTYHIGFIYASIFYLLYMAINIAYNVRENKEFIGYDFSILLINTGLFFAVGLYLLTEMNLEQYRGLFSAILGFTNLCLSYILFRLKKVDANILYLLIGLTLTFVSLTAPIQLKGNNITLFWASEMVLLYWLYLKSGIKLIRLTSQIIWIAMLISLFMDWLFIYNSHVILPVLLNKGFITTSFAAFATLLLAYLVRIDHTEEDTYEFRVPSVYLQIVFVALLFLAGFWEINYQFTTRFQIRDLNILYLMLYIPSFAVILNVLVKRFRVLYYPWRINLIGTATVIAIYLTYFGTYFSLQAELLQKFPQMNAHFITHWLASVLIGMLFYQLVLLCKNQFEDVWQANFSWIICGSVVLFLSLELSLASNALFFSASNSIAEIQRIYIKTGLPVIWGLASFFIMWLGMRNKNRTLRIISLSLFTLTLLKLFLFDIVNIPAAGKIVAFFCLGVLLLIVSFMYQKVKRIIISDEDQSRP